MAYSNNSFPVIRVYPLSSNLEIMEALAPNLCVQKSSIAHLEQSFFRDTRTEITIVKWGRTARAADGLGRVWVINRDGQRLGMNVVHKA